MKSIIEQASSIIKAVEKAWNQAEKPAEFSIKVFEQEERNFFGMATKPAKIGIFFSDKPVLHEKPTSRPRQEIKECRPSFTKTENKPVAKPAPQPAHKAQPAQHKPSASSFAPISPKPQSAGKATADKPDNRQKTTEQNHVAAPQVEKAQRIPTTWNDTMIAATHNWLKKTLSLMGLGSIDFNSEIAGKNLKLTFNTPLVADPMHEKQLFRSFAHLIMSSLRNQYKQEIKDLKVILIRPE